MERFNNSDRSNTGTTSTSTAAATSNTNNTSSSNTVTTIHLDDHVSIDVDEYTSQLLSLFTSLPTIPGPGGDDCNIPISNSDSDPDIIFLPSSSGPSHHNPASTSLNNGQLSVQPKASSSSASDKRLSLEPSRQKQKWDPKGKGKGKGKGNGKQSSSGSGKTQGNREGEGKPRENREPKEKQEKTTRKSIIREQRFDTEEGRSKMKEDWKRLQEEWKAEKKKRRRRRSRAKTGSQIVPPSWNQSYYYQIPSLEEVAYQYNWQPTPAGPGPSFNPTPNDPSSGFILHPQAQVVRAPPSNSESFYHQLPHHSLGTWGENNTQTFFLPHEPQHQTSGFQPFPPQLQSQSQPQSQTFQQPLSSHIEEQDSHPGFMASLPMMVNNNNNNFSTSSDPYNGFSISFPQPQPQPQSHRDLLPQPQPITPVSYYENNITTIPPPSPPRKSLSSFFDFGFGRDQQRSSFVTNSIGLGLLGQSPSYPQVDINNSQQQAMSMGMTRSFSDETWKTSGDIMPSHSHQHVSQYQPASSQQALPTQHQPQQFLQHQPQQFLQHQPQQFFQHQPQQFLQHQPQQFFQCQPQQLIQEQPQRLIPNQQGHPLRHPVQHRYNSKHMMGFNNTQH